MPWAGNSSLNSDYSPDNEDKNKNKNVQSSSASRGNTINIGGRDVNIDKDTAYRQSLLDPANMPEGLSRGGDSLDNLVVKTEYIDRGNGNIMRLDHTAGGRTYHTFIPNTNIRMGKFNDDIGGQAYHKQNSAYSFSTMFDRSPEQNAPPKGFTPGASEDWLNSNLIRSNQLASQMSPTTFDVAGQTYTVSQGPDGVRFDPFQAALTQATGGVGTTLPTATLGVSQTLPVQIALNQGILSSLSQQDPSAIVPSLLASMGLLEYKPYEMQEFKQSKADARDWIPSIKQVNEWNAAEKAKAEQHDKNYDNMMTLFKEILGTGVSQANLLQQEQQNKYTRAKNYYDALDLVPPTDFNDPSADIRAAQAMYNEAKARGDQKGMDEAHAFAEALRMAAGWGTGGPDGSGTSGFMTAAGTPTAKAQREAAKFEYDSRQDLVSNAWKIVNAIGYVPNKEIGDLVGLPEGTVLSDENYRRYQMSQSGKGDMKEQIKANQEEALRLFMAQSEFYNTGVDYLADVRRYRDQLLSILGTEKYQELEKDAIAMAKGDLPGSSSQGEEFTQEELDQIAKTGVLPMGQSGSKYQPRKGTKFTPGGGSPLGEVLKNINPIEPTPVNGNVSGNVKEWVNQAVKITGVDEDWKPYLEWLVEHESNGNPRAVNPRAVGREHATGLMQTLPSTFRAHAAPGMTDIYNPVHNLVAAIGYIKGRYKHPKNAVNGWTSRGGY